MDNNTPAVGQVVEAVKQLDAASPKASSVKQVQSATDRYLKYIDGEKYPELARLAKEAAGDTNTDQEELAKQRQLVKSLYRVLRNHGVTLE